MNPIHQHKTPWSRWIKVRMELSWDALALTSFGIFGKKPVGFYPISLCGSLLLSGSVGTYAVPSSTPPRDAAGSRELKLRTWHHESSCSWYLRHEFFDNLLMGDHEIIQSVKALSILVRRQQACSIMQVCVRMVMPAHPPFVNAT